MYNGLYRGTNPYIVIKFKSDSEIEFNSIDEIWVTIKAKSGSKEITKQKSDMIFDVDNAKIYVQLTQQDTLLFPVGNVDIQARIKFLSGSVVATSIVSNYPIKRILREGVM